MERRGIILGGDIAVRTLCGRLLSEAGVAHDEAVDAAQAEALLTGPARYDLLVLDSDMPGGGAASVARAFRRKFPGGLVLVMTDDQEPSFLSEDEARTMLRLSKPFSIDLFLSLVRGRTIP